jgi:hypothetical protein
MPMMKRPFRFLLLGLALLPAACGDFPEPMMGYPGRMGMILAHPPPQRIVVPVPHRALLDDASASVFATDLTNSLVAQTIPAFAQKPDRGDWVLAATASLTGDLVTPTYSIVDPRGHVQGHITGTPLPSSAWANGDAATLGEAATAVGPRLASLLSDIDAALKENDPHSLYNRPPRVEFFGMKGAPGDGDQSLAKEMRKDLPGLGVVLVDQRDTADYLVRGASRLSTVDANTQHIDIMWTVQTADGKEVGKVTQPHDFPKGSLDTYWGDVAVVAVSAAAPGVKEVIDNNIGKRAAPHPSPAAKTS